MKKRPATKAELDFVSSLLGPRGVDVRDLGPLEAADLRKHELVLSAGDDPDASGLVVSGVLREFYLQPDGSEHTRGFGQTSDSFGSLSDSLQHRASRVFVRAETAARVVFVPWSKVRALMKKSLAWERLAAGIVERLYLKKSVREYELLALDAMGRYQSMREQYPGLEQKVPAMVIASYLGITNVHLSRLRRRLR